MIEIILSIASFLFGSGITVIIFKYIRTKVLKATTKSESVQKGVQALLRDRLYQMYNHYHEKGYAPSFARENFLNMYDQYHGLGKNGVMEDYKNKFNNLPTKAEYEKMKERERDD